jgi:cob(I)alamin adenosyltransferase
MSNRLNKIATRTGDDGTTGLGNGSRVRKDDMRTAALGDVDELNAQLGLLLCEPLPDDVRDALTLIQHELFNLGGVLCLPGRATMRDAAMVQLEQWLADWNAALPPLCEFVLPGGTRAAALAHVCRTVCRRAERTLVALAAHAPQENVPCRYLNRLSDLLFVLARVLNRAADENEVLWRHERDTKA